MRHVRAANEELGSRVAETLRRVVHGAVVLILAACATLDGARGEVSGVTWDVVDVRGSDGRESDETRWNYAIVLRNQRSAPVEVFHESVVLAYNRVFLSPEVMDERWRIAPGETVRLERQSSFRRSAFFGTSGSPPIGSRESAARAPHDGMWIYHQFLGRHDRGAILLNIDFVPERHPKR
jgi:hypothetical protein